MKHTLLTGAAALALTSGMAMSEQLTVFGPWLGPDQENVETVLALFAEASGHDVRYVGSDSFEQQIMVDAEAGSAPNVAVFPQPGLAAGMAARGFLTPLADGTADWIRENYAAGQSWVDLGTYAGADGASWTLVVTAPDGTSCLLAYGRNWKDTPVPHLAGRPDS